MVSFDLNTSNPNAIKCMGNVNMCPQLSGCWNVKKNRTPHSLRCFYVYLDPQGRCNLKFPEGEQTRTRFLQSTTFTPASTHNLVETVVCQTQRFPKARWYFAQFCSFRRNSVCTLQNFRGKLLFFGNFWRVCLLGTWNTHFFFPRLFLVFPPHCQCLSFLLVCEGLER